MTRRRRCPECRVGTLEVVTDGLAGQMFHPGYHVIGTELPIRMVMLPFDACNACEYCRIIYGPLPK